MHNARYERASQTPIQLPTETERRGLQAIRNLRRLAPGVLFMGMALLSAIRLIPMRYATLQWVLFIGVMLIVLGVLAYMVFFQRCPRCSGQFAIPGCLQCGLKPDQPRSAADV